MNVARMKRSEIRDNTSASITCARLQFLRREIWVDANGKVVRFKLAFINRDICRKTKKLT